MSGRFISVEGIDGAGKSTHLAWLVAHLKSCQIPLLQSREPGGTPLGEKLRQLLLSEDMHLETEALLMFAARNEHLQQLILPALRRGEWVLCDRFTDATYAYQCGGRGLDFERFQQLERWVQLRDAHFVEPDLTLIFDVPVEIGQARMAATRELDRFEMEQLEFHIRVRNAYLERANQYPQRIRIIDANRPLAAIQTELEQIIAEFIA
ncbi:dTMP kinase [Chitinibacter fontanus]|uniref:dTMP kinase n=1 Tax=Chitinibacter fontanus TaxID=1737446 RepID=UPI001D13FE5B